MQLFAVAAFGLVGVLARHGVNEWVNARWPGPLPVATLLINTFGCLGIGLLFALSRERGLMGPTLATGLLVGGLGGFTTYSTWTLELVYLVQSARWRTAALYLGLSLSLGVMATVAGLWLGRRLGLPAA